MQTIYLFTDIRINFNPNYFMLHLLLFSLTGFVSEHSDIFVAILICLIGGYIAEFIVPGRGYGLIFTAIIGIIGGWLGQMFFAFISVPTDIPYFNAVLRTILGSIIVVCIFNVLTGGRRKANGKEKEKDVYDWANE